MQNTINHFRLKWLNARHFICPDDLEYSTGTILNKSNFAYIQNAWRTFRIWRNLLHAIVLMDWNSTSEYIRQKLISQSSVYQFWTIFSYSFFLLKIQRNFWKFVFDYSCRYSTWFVDNGYSMVRLFFLLKGLRHEILTTVSDLINAWNWSWHKIGILSANINLSNYPTHTHCRRLELHHLCSHWAMNGLRSAKSLFSCIQCAYSFALNARWNWWCFTVYLWKSL